MIPTFKTYTSRNEFVQKLDETTLDLLSFKKNTS